MNKKLLLQQILENTVSSVGLNSSVTIIDIIDT